MKREDIFKKLYGIVESNDGFVALPKSVHLNIEEGRIECKAVTIKYAYQSDEKVYTNLVAIDSNFENWDVDDYLSAKDMKRIVDCISGKDVSEKPKGAKAKEKSVIEDDVFFTDKEIFDDEDEHYYRVRCLDGIGYAVPNDETDPLLLITYPTMDFAKQYGMREEARDWRGLYDVPLDKIGYGDIMMRFGRLHKVTVFNDNSDFNF